MTSGPHFSEEYLWERETVVPEFDVSSFAREATRAVDGDPTVVVPREVIAALRAESAAPTIIRKALTLVLMVSCAVSVSGCFHRHHRAHAMTIYDHQATTSSVARAPNGG